MGANVHATAANYFVHTVVMPQRWIVEMKKIVAVVVFRLCVLKPY